jgi:hypothetical protein
MPCSEVQRTQDEYLKSKTDKMKQLSLNHMENINGGDSNWLGFACGVGIVSLEASFAFPLLFAFTAPLTVSACAAAAIDAAIKNSK